MTHRTLSNRNLRTAGSAMDIWPTGSYSRYMPKGSEQERIAQYWESVGTHLRSAMSQYAIEHPPKR